MKLYIISEKYNHNVKTIVDIFNNDEELKTVYVTDNKINCKEGDIIYFIHCSNNFINNISNMNKNKNMNIKTVIHNESEITFELVYSKLVKLLDKCVYVVGKSQYHKNLKFHRMFKYICFVKCPCIDHEKNDKYICSVTPDYLHNNIFLKIHNIQNIYVCKLQYKKFGKHYKDKKHKVYTNLIKNVHQIDDIHLITNSKEYELGYDVNKLEQGWMSSGMLTLIHFSRIFETVYVSGFSHFDKNGNPQKPVGNLKNPYNNLGGNHSNDYEYYLLTKIIEENNNIFSL